MNEKNANIFQLSYWERETFFKNIDFAIIGSGIVGLNTALELRKIYPTKKIVVFERSFLPYGASTRNAGFACFGSLSELIHDTKTLGEETVFKLTQKRIRGIQKIKSTLGISSADFRNYGGHELFFKTNQALYESCAAQISHYNKMVEEICGEPHCFSIQNKNIKKFGFAQTEHLILNKLEGQIDTGKLMKSLMDKVKSKQIQVFTGLPIAQITQNHNRAVLEINEQTIIEVNKVIVCTNAFTNTLLPSEEIIPARAQVLITKPIPKLKVKGTFHFDEGYYYFRNIHDRILFGGARNMAFKEEETTRFGITDKIQTQLEFMLREVILPNDSFEVDIKWSGIMAFGSEKVPIVRQISKDVFVAARMNGMGVALGGIIAEEVTALVKETEE